jgi:hypothetical protein
MKQLKSIGNYHFFLRRLSRYLPPELLQLLNSDLSAALGHLGNPGHAEVQEAMKTIFICAQRHGRSIGILAPEEAAARRYLEQGARLLANALLS